MADQKHYFHSFILTVILMLWLSPGYGQGKRAYIDPSLFYDPGFTVTHLEADSSIQIRDSLQRVLCRMDLHCDACPDTINMDRYYSEFLLEHRPSIHLIDADQDGDYDILFDGKECSGFEAGQVEWYENTGKSLVQRFKYPGTLLHLDLKSGQMVVFDYPCCAEVTNYILEYQFNPESWTFTPLEASLIVGNWHLSEGAFMPTNLPLHDKITFNQEKEIRWSPNTNDNDPTGFCENGKTNIIWTYPAGSTGTVLYLSPDNWAFVKMDHHPGFELVCPNPVKGEEWATNELTVYGWFKL